MKFNLIISTVLILSVSLNAMEPKHINQGELPVFAGGEECPLCFSTMDELGTNQACITACCGQFICRNDAELIERRAQELYQNSQNTEGRSQCGTSPDVIAEEHGKCPLCRNYPLITESMPLSRRQDVRMQIEQDEALARQIDQEDTSIQNQHVGRCTLPAVTLNQQETTQRGTRATTEQRPAQEQIDAVAVREKVSGAAHAQQQAPAIVLPNNKPRAYIYDSYEIGTRVGNRVKRKIVIRLDRHVRMQNYIDDFFQDLSRAVIRQTTSMLPGSYSEGGTSGRQIVISTFMGREEVERAMQLANQEANRKNREW